MCGLDLQCAGAEASNLGVLVACVSPAHLTPNGFSHFLPRLAFLASTCSKKEPAMPEQTVGSPLAWGKSAAEPEFWSGWHPSLCSLLALVISAIIYGSLLYISLALESGLRGDLPGPATYFS